MGEGDGEGHALLGLVRGVPKHQALKQTTGVKGGEEKEGQSMCPDCRLPFYPFPPDKRKRGDCLASLPKAPYRSYLRKRYSSEPNLISGPEIVIVVVDPDPVGDVLALLLDHVQQAHGLEVEA